MRAPRIPRDTGAARTSTRVLKALAGRSLTTRQLEAELEIADHLPFARMLAVMNSRGLLQAAPQSGRGNPNLWSLSAKGAESLALRESPKVKEAKPARAARAERPRVVRLGRPWAPRQARAKAYGEVDARVAGWAWWFVAAGWPLKSVAHLFGVKPRDLGHAVGLLDARMAAAESPSPAGDSERVAA